MPTNFNHTGYPKGHPIRVELERREASGRVAKKKDTLENGVETNITFDGVDADEYVRSIRDGTYEPDHLVQAPEMVRDCSTCRYNQADICAWFAPALIATARHGCIDNDKHQYWKAKDEN